MDTPIHTLWKWIQRLTTPKTVVHPNVHTESPRTENQSDIATFTQNTLENWLTLSDMANTVRVYEDTPEALSLEIQSNTDTGRVIGKNGQTLDAFQVLLKAVIQRKFGQRVSVVIDVNHYRERHEEKLQRDAQKLAQKVETEQKTYRLRPMPAQDRRAIHRVFENHNTIVSQSVGHGDYRCVTLSPKR
jgi:predicted RNA-binding protein Jag